MFGLGKKKIPRPDIVGDAIVNSIRYSITAKEESGPRIPHEAEDFYYTDGRINSSVPNEYLGALPMHFRRHWPYLDCELCFPQIEEAILDIPELSQESKTKIKAISFGELPKEDVEE